MVMTYDFNVCKNPLLWHQSDHLCPIFLHRQKVSASE